MYSYMKQNNYSEENYHLHYLLSIYNYLTFVISMWADDENVPLVRGPHLRCWICNQDKEYSRNMVNVIQSISANCLADTLKSLYSVSLHCVR